MHDAASAPDVQATFCATLVDEWIAAGVRHAVVAPGSRSTPLALEITSRPELSVHVVHDERVAAFVALGIGTRGRPALLLCTSGTAAANFLPAVVEAGLSNVPMIVLSADRPEELRGVGAPQTIDQIDLYGSHVRWFHDPGVPESEQRATWRPLARRVFAEAADGPVQLNLPFREPLLGTAGELPAATDEDDAAVDRQRRVDPVPDGFDCQRGVILAGGASGVDPAGVQALHDLTDWPVLADAASAMRHLDGVVTTADALLRHDAFAADHAPDVVVRVGRPASSKVLSQWSARPGTLVVQVGGPGRIDPNHDVAAVCRIDDLLASSPQGATGTTWMTRWRHADRLAEQAILEGLDLLQAPSEPGIARAVAEVTAEIDVGLTVSSSMPVRDVEWYGGRGARCHANRGANGIDGVMSTALGRALASGRPEVVLVGDLAFLHDSNALVALAARPVDLRIVVVDNGGGGIFSFLPQATHLGAERFEQLFGTPHGSDVVAVARAHGIEALTVSSTAELRDHLSRPGPWLCRVVTDRVENVAVHDRLHSAVAAALG